MSGRIVPLLLSVALFGAIGCRDAPATFTPVDRTLPDTEVMWRLTVNPGDDRVPSWSPGGDTIYYSAPGYDLFPRTEAVLLAIPVHGGAARLVLPEIQIQAGTTRRLAAPVVAPEGDRLAYIDLWHVRIQDKCAPEFPCEFGSWESLVPRPEELRARVRRFDEVGHPDVDPWIRLDVGGYHFDQTVFPFGLDGVHVYHDYPVYRIIREERAWPLRASWEPNGDRLAVTDGEGIMLWSPGQEPVRLPGTELGVSPAWSPDGEWIAFTRLVRTDSLTRFCVQFVLGEPACALEQTVYTDTERLLTLIPADGGATVELGTGEDPAWSPDGRFLFIRKHGQIVRLEIDTGSELPVPGTLGGRDPAVSPDGRLLAFSRSGERGDLDIWVRRIEGL